MAKSGRTSKGKFWSTLVTQHSLSASLSFSGPILSFVRPGETPCSHRAWRTGYWTLACCLRPVWQLSYATHLGCPMGFACTPWTLPGGSVPFPSVCSSGCMTSVGDISLENSQDAGWTGRRTTNCNFQDADNKKNNSSPFQVSIFQSRAQLCINTELNCILLVVMILNEKLWRSYFLKVSASNYFWGKIRSPPVARWQTVLRFVCRTLVLFHINSLICVIFYFLRDYLNYGFWWEMQQITSE